MADRRFPAMGSECHVIVTGGRGDLVDLAVRRVVDLESRWSRFLPASEVTLMNRLGSNGVTVSWETFELVRLAVEAWRLTDGTFDPTILPALVSAGYDRDFRIIDPDSSSSFLPFPPSSGCSGIRLDASRRSVALPFGCSFDPGGIGKGLAADIVVGELLAAGATGAMVDLGGDLRCAGDAPRRGAWVVGIADPRHPDRDIATVTLEQGAVATSTTLIKTWRRNGSRMHHIIDPATGTSLATGSIAASAVTGAGWWAEVAAKAALSGRVVPRSHVLVVEDSGTVHAAPCFEVAA